jgi:DNA-binding transcriptional LysR family regulator
MHLSPSALSIQLKQLEEAVGVALFEQIGKQKYLTTAGRELADACENIFAELDTVEMRLAQLKGNMVGTLRLAVVTSAKYFAPHLLGHFHRRHPGVKLQLKVANRDQILQRLRDNADDLVIMAHPPDDLSVKAIPFLDNPLVVVAAPDHPLAKERQIQFMQLMENDFLIRESGSGTRMAMEEMFQKAGVTMNSLMELGSSEAIKQGVMAGLGLSILSRYCVWLELKTGYLTELDVVDFPDLRVWNAVHLSGKVLSPVAESFLEFIVSNAQSVANEVADRYDPLQQMSVAP